MRPQEDEEEVLIFEEDWEEIDDVKWEKYLMELSCFDKSYNFANGVSI